MIIFIHAVPLDETAEVPEPIEVTDEVDESMALDALVGMAEPEQFVPLKGRAMLGSLDVAPARTVRYYRHTCHGHGEASTNQGCTMDEIEVEDS